MQLLNGIPIYLEELRVALQNKTTAKVVLKAVKMMAVNDPTIIIQWNDQGFNDVPVTPGCRNGVVGQTKQAIIHHFTTSGGTDVCGLNTIFLFKTSQCERNIPKWY